MNKIIELPLSQQAKERKQRLEIQKSNAKYANEISIIFEFSTKKYFKKNKTLFKSTFSDEINSLEQLEKIIQENKNNFRLENNETLPVSILFQILNENGYLKNINNNKLNRFKTTLKYFDKYIGIISNLEVFNQSEEILYWLYFNRDKFISDNGKTLSYSTIISILKFAGLLGNINEKSIKFEISAYNFIITKKEQFLSEIQKINLKEFDETEIKNYFMQLYNIGNDIWKPIKGKKEKVDYKYYNLIMKYLISIFKGIGIKI